MKSSKRKPAHRRKNHFHDYLYRSFDQHLSLENITVKAVHEDLRIIQHFALKTFAVLNDWFRMVLISLVILWQLDGN